MTCSKTRVLVNKKLRNIDINNQTWELTFVGDELGILVVNDIK